MALTDAEIRELEEQAWQLRHDIINVTVWAGGAHIGGGLSMLDILVLLYFKYLNIDSGQPEMADRDRVVVSKGHGGVGFAPVLARRGYFDFEALKTFNQFGSPFGMHLDASKVTGVDASTGSLGHGFSMAVGLALGARAQKKAWKTYCILGDGECNEGAVWEAAMSASHFGLTNLVTIVDRNGYMIDGATEEVMALEPFSDKWRAFGFHVLEVDGHDFAALAGAIDISLSGDKGPCVIMAHTKKGRGIDYMEGNVKWHYGSIDSTLADKARASVDRLYGKA
ncbi:transketolase [Desulfoluna butyratoxydans]|uniref:Thiamin diphosphate-binding fold n=1 Tax=Desulfoluna butyratoxydans TaxID=231438 RepID=A0A4U8YRQ7_9BACT|nr:transketolase [Desulfoluna butyratoxydans]VFQ47055.1 thiamin diphosphate-binding fold [Desulfoluna butyratoxydans]